MIWEEMTNCRKTKSLVLNAWMIIQFVQSSVHLLFFTFSDDEQAKFSKMLIVSKYSLLVGPSVIGITTKG